MPRSGDTRHCGRRQPIVRASFYSGGHPVMMLAGPAQAHGWMVGILDEEGAELLADAFRHAAWEAMELARWRPAVRLGRT